MRQASRPDNLRSLIRPTVDPSDLIGETVRAVILGWHVYHSQRSPHELFLRFDDRDIEVYTAGDGSLALIPRPVPTGFSMDQYGSWEFREAASDHPAVVLVGHPLTRVDRIRWNGGDVGLRLVTEVGLVLLANEADEVFASSGALPTDYADAAIG